MANHVNYIQLDLNVNGSICNCKVKWSELYILNRSDAVNSLFQLFFENYYAFSFYEHKCLHLFFYMIIGN